MPVTITVRPHDGGGGEGVGCVREREGGQVVAGGEAAHAQLAGPRLDEDGPGDGGQPSRTGEPRDLLAALHVQHAHVVLRAGAVAAFGVAGDPDEPAGGVQRLPVDGGPVPEPHAELPCGLARAGCPTAPPRRRFYRAEHGDHHAAAVALGEADEVGLDGALVVELALGAGERVADVDAVAVAPGRDRPPGDEGERPEAVREIRDRRARGTGPQVPRPPDAAVAVRAPGGEGQRVPGGGGGDAVELPGREQAGEHAFRHGTEARAPRRDRSARWRNPVGRRPIARRTLGARTPDERLLPRRPRAADHRPLVLVGALR